jgi:hypothetical protein
MLPVEQMAGGQTRVTSMVRAKGRNANATRGSNHGLVDHGLVHGYSTQNLGQSDSDSDSGLPLHIPRAPHNTQGLPLPLLPPGPWQREQPASGHALVGWRVSAYFRNSASDQTWHEGLVVDFNGGDHVVFHAIDHYHESWTLPDDELCYHKPQATGSHRSRVTQKMQQTLDMDG